MLRIYVNILIELIFKKTFNERRWANEDQY